MILLSCPETGSLVRVGDVPDIWYAVRPQWCWRHQAVATQGALQT